MNAEFQLCKTVKGSKNPAAVDRHVLEADPDAAAGVALQQHFVDEENDKTKPRTKNGLTCPFVLIRFPDCDISCQTVLHTFDVCRGAISENGIEARVVILGSIEGDPPTDLVEARRDAQEARRLEERKAESQSESSEEEAEAMPADSENEGGEEEQPDDAEPPDSEVEDFAKDEQEEKSTNGVDMETDVDVNAPRNVNNVNAIEGSHDFISWKHLQPILFSLMSNFSLNGAAGDGAVQVGRGANDNAVIAALKHVRKLLLQEKSRLSSNQQDAEAAPHEAAAAERGPPGVVLKQTINYGGFAAGTGATVIMLESLVKHIDRATAAAELKLASFDGDGPIAPAEMQAVAEEAAKAGGVGVGAIMACVPQLRQATASVALPPEFAQQVAQLLQSEERLAAYEAKIAQKMTEQFQTVVEEFNKKHAETVDQLKRIESFMSEATRQFERFDRSESQSSIAELCSLVKQIIPVKQESIGNDESYTQMVNTTNDDSMSDEPRQDFISNPSCSPSHPSFQSPSAVSRSPI